MRGKGCRGSTGCRLGRLSRLTRGRDSLKWDRRSLGWCCRDWRFDPISSLCPKAQTAELHLHRGHAASRSGQDDTLLCILVPSSSGARTGLLRCRTLGGGSDGHVESRRTSVCRHGLWGQRSSRLVHLAPVGVSARSSNSGILSPCVLLDRLFDSVGIRLLWLQGSSSLVLNLLLGGGVSKGVDGGGFLQYRLGQSRCGVLWHRGRLWLVLRSKRQHSHVDLLTWRFGPRSTLLLEPYSTEQSWTPFRPLLAQAHLQTLQQLKSRLPWTARQVESSLLRSGNPDPP